MTQQVRFGDYAQEVSIKQRQISFNLVADYWFPTGRIHLAPSDVYHILKPYITPRLLEQFKAVVPLTLYLVLFQLFFLRQNVQDSWQIMGGLLAVILGLMVFMEGLKLGLMPLGQAIGETLPRYCPLAVVLSIVFLLGIGVTLAEPAVGALKTAGSILRPEQTPLLFALLNEHSHLLVLVIGIGVGLAALLGTLRFIQNWGLKPLVYISVVPCLALTAYAQSDPRFEEIIGLAWDCGGITTGPVTVPLVLALGIGVASSVGRKTTSLSGFGIVTLASLFPVMGVLILAFLVTPDPDFSLPGQSYVSWLNRTPVNEILAACRAIVPLIGFLLWVMKKIVKREIRNAGMIAYGLTLSLTGMMMFNVGLTYGLAALGDQTGGILPAAFTRLQGIQASPLYPYALGMLIVVFFAWCLGFGATLAEPALSAMGFTVEYLTNGAFQKKLLVRAVSFGVACGVALGVVKLIYDVQLASFLIPGYGVVLLLTLFSTEEFVNVAWDSAGVTTGPVTVPLVLAMGLGLGEAMGVSEGFGVLALASLCPIASVLLCGIYIQWKIKHPRAT